MVSGRNLHCRHIYYSFTETKNEHEHENLHKESKEHNPVPTYCVVH